MQFPIPTAAGPIPIDTADRPLFILGRNGTGKSALIFYIRDQLQGQGDRVIYLPGSRPSYFDADNLSMTPSVRSQYIANSRSWDVSPDTRIRPLSGTSRNEKAIYDLQVAEIQYRVDAANDIERQGVCSPAISMLQSKASPVDKVNRLLTQSNLPTRVVIDSGELKATRNGNIYSILRMSDGERTALILLADVIAASTGSIFLIDEPELHLHRAIVVPLIQAVVAERPDCTVIVSTHELALPREHSDCKVVIVRGCTWNTGATSASLWDIDVISDPGLIPDDVLTDILGSRRKVLFVEGNTNSSLDQPLYSILFPDTSIVTRNGCADVRRAVVGLKLTYDHHHVDVFGLVDNDGMDPAFVQELLQDDIYALPMFSVESLYYCDEVQRALAEIQSNTLGIPASELISNAMIRCVGILHQPGKAEHQAARLSERQIRDSILKAMPDRAAILASSGQSLNITIQSTYSSNLQTLQALIAAQGVAEIIRDFPVRESGILTEIAKALRFAGEPDYRKAALIAIFNNSALQAVVKGKLGGLACISQTRQAHRGL